MSGPSGGRDRHAPEQVSAKAMIADYVPLLMKEALALRERLV
jgi:hypothetical protein